MKKSENGTAQKAQALGQMGTSERCQRLASYTRIEVEIPDFANEHLGPFIRFLAELLAEERQREIENVEKEDGR